MEIIAVRIKEVIILQKMIKIGLKKDMTNFLQTLNKLSSKKKRQINKNKQRASIKKTSLRKTNISSLDNSDKKELSVPIVATKITKSNTKNIDIVIISADVYYAACHLKRVQVFAISMSNI